MISICDFSLESSRGKFQNRLIISLNREKDKQKFRGLHMKLISVNVSLPKEIIYRGRKITTGIFKEPVQGRVMLRTLNLDGDGQADLRVHGGPDQAAYVYPVEHYDDWKELLGRDDLDYGQFGENFTTAGLLENDVRLGDVFRFGGAIVQVTTPRMPCGKLDMKMDDPNFKKKFRASGRSGFYLRVLQEGEVSAGDEIELIESDPKQMTVEEMFRKL
jgi:MOSC domain-containing protein YiiM